MIKSRKSCFVCGKTWTRRNLISHAKNKSIRRANPNLRRIRTKVGEAARSVWVCAKCLKRGKVVPAPARQIPRP